MMIYRIFFCGGCNKSLEVIWLIWMAVLRQTWTLFVSGLFVCNCMCFFGVFSNQNTQTCLVRSLFVISSGYSWKLKILTKTFMKSRITLNYSNHLTSKHKWQPSKCWSNFPNKSSKKMGSSFPVFATQTWHLHLKNYRNYHLGISCPVRIGRNPPPLRSRWFFFGRTFWRHACWWYQIWRKWSKILIFLLPFVHLTNDLFVYVKKWDDLKSLFSVDESNAVGDRFGSGFGFGWISWELGIRVQSCPWCQFGHPFGAGYGSNFLLDGYITWSTWINKITKASNCCFPFYVRIWRFSFESYQVVPILLRDVFWLWIGTWKQTMPW